MTNEQVKADIAANLPDNTTRAITPAKLRTEMGKMVDYSDTSAAELTAPPLTTVTVDHHAMGARAAHLLLEAVNRPPDGTDSPLQPHGGTVLLPVTLHDRASTAPPRA